VPPMELLAEALTVLLGVFAAEPVAAADKVKESVPEPLTEGLTDTDGERAAEPVFCAVGDAEELPLAVKLALPVGPLEVECDEVCVWLTELDWEGEPDAEPGPRLPEWDTLPLALPGGMERVTVAEVHTVRVPVGQEEGEAAKERERVGEAVVVPLTVRVACTEPDTEVEAQNVVDTDTVVVAEPVREVVGVPEEEADREGLEDALADTAMEGDTEGEGDTVREPRGEEDTLGDTVVVMVRGEEGVADTVRGALRVKECVGDTEGDTVTVLHSVGVVVTLADTLCVAETEGQADAVAGAEPVASAVADAPAVDDTDEVTLAERVPPEDADGPPVAVPGAVPVARAEPVMGESDGVTEWDMEMEGEEEGERVPAALRVCEGDAVPVRVMRGEPVADVEAVSVAEVVVVGGGVPVGASGVGVATVVTVTVGLLLGGTLTVPECVSVEDSEGEGDCEVLTEAEGDAEGLAVADSVADTEAEGQEVEEGVCAADALLRMEAVWLAEAQCEEDTDTELDTEGDTVGRKEPVFRGLTDGLPEKDGSGEAQGVTVCVRGGVRDTEPEDVPLGEPLIVLIAERV
jgi:hypothetical protein